MPPSTRDTVPCPVNYKPRSGLRLEARRAERSKSHAVPISGARFSGPERNPKGIGPKKIKKIAQVPFTTFENPGRLAFN